MNTIVIQNVKFENVPDSKIEIMVAEGLIYKGIDGNYYESAGKPQEYSEMDFSAQIDASRARDARTGYQHSYE